MLLLYPKVVRFFSISLIFVPVPRLPSAILIENGAGIFASSFHISSQTLLYTFGRKSQLRNLHTSCIFFIYFQMDYIFAGKFSKEFFVKYKIRLRKVYTRCFHILYLVSVFVLPKK